MSAMSSPFTLRGRSVAAAVLAVGLAGAGRAQAGPCRTQPVPDGLGKECQRLTFLVPNPASEETIRTVLNMQLIQWMERCFPGHGPMPPDEGEGSVDYVAGLVSNVPSYVGTATILAEYTPGTYTDNGKTCQGADEVRFFVNGARGTVDADGDDMVVSDRPSSELVQKAAAAALEAIKDPSVTFRPGGELNRLMSVLIALKDNGTSEIDDAWYNVAPSASGDPFAVPPACFTEYHPAGRECLPADQALAACTRHLGTDLVRHWDGGRAPLATYGKAVEYLANDIQRGFNYVYQVHGVEGAEAAACSSITQVFLPRIVEASKKRSLYGIGSY